MITLALLAGCAGSPPTDPRFPARNEGCDVRVFNGTPDVPTTNIGPVRARCDLDVSEADCVRTLKDQVCKLGGDVVWGVEERRDEEHAKNLLGGRAAHTGVLPPK